MLSAYDCAIELRPDRAIAEPTVKEAMRQLYGAPSPRELAGGPALEVADREAGEAGEANGEEDGELSEEVRVLIGRLDILRRARSLSRILRPHTGSNR
jgi:hypothetical protein